MNQSFMQDEIISADKAQTNSQQPEQHKSLFNLRVQPGFECFFQSYVESHHLHYYQCYQRLMKNSLEMDKRRFPLQKIFRNDKLSMHEKLVKIYTRAGPHEKLYMQAKNQGINMYAYGKESEEQVNNLQKQIELYRRQNEETLECKKNEFKLIRQKEEAMKMERMRQQERKQQSISKTQLWMKVNSKPPNDNEPSVFPNIAKWLHERNSTKTEQLAKGQQNKMMMPTINGISTWLQHHKENIIIQFQNLSASIRSQIPW